MKTPITDAAVIQAGDCYHLTDVIHLDLARRLETDRAALIEALTGLLDISEGVLPLGSFGEKARIALTAACANFPDVSAAICSGYHCENEPQLEPHSCPFLSDVKDDEETLCTCCARCTHECAQDI